MLTHHAGDWLKDKRHGRGRFIFASNGKIDDTRWDTDKDSEKFTDVTDLVPRVQFITARAEKAAFDARQYSICMCSSACTHNLTMHIVLDQGPPVVPV